MSFGGSRAPRTLCRVMLLDASPFKARTLRILPPATAKENTRRSTIFICTGKCPLRVGLFCKSTHSAFMNSSELQHGGWHRLVPVLFWYLLQSSCCMLHCCSASCMGAESRLQVKNVQRHEVTCPIAWGDSHGKLLSELWPSRPWRSWKLGLESATLHGWRPFV